LLLLLLLPYSPCWALAAFSVSWSYTVGRTTQTGDQPLARSLPTHRTPKTKNKRIQTPTPWVGFEPTIPAFELAETVHVLDRAATLIGSPGRFAPQRKRP
jgi:hypothetical protein